MLHFKASEMDSFVYSVHIIVTCFWLFILFVYSFYQVSSDLSMVSGASVLTVDPDDIVPYSLSISPWRRGVFQGKM